MITYKDNLKEIFETQLSGFFVGWPDPPTPKTHLEILKKSSSFVLAIDEDTGCVVGFINAVSDNIMSAYIPLLEVLPEYQKRGIGQELVKKIIKIYENLYMIDLCCDKETQPFYEKLGLVKSTGMFVRNFDKQACE